MKPLKIANSYGSVDCSAGFSHKSYTWVRGSLDHLLKICSLKRVAYAKAVVGWQADSKPVYDGIIISVTWKTKLEDWLKRDFAEVEKEHWENKFG